METTDGVGYNLFCSGDGSKVIGYFENGLAFSTNGGSSFAPAPFAAHAAQLSRNGKILAIAGAGISVTTNNGATWSQSATLKTNGCDAVALSADGHVIYAGLTIPPGPIYISTNFGVTWHATSTPSVHWSAIACTADGSNVIAGGESGPLYISQDSGNTWQLQVPKVSGFIGTKFFFHFLTSSADGSLIIGAFDPGVCLSRDFGATWIIDGLSADTEVACTADGTLLVAASYFNVITQNLAPPLNIVFSGPNFNQRFLARAFQPLCSSKQASDLFLHQLARCHQHHYRHQLPQPRHSRPARHRRCLLPPPRPQPLNSFAVQLSCSEGFFLEFLSSELKPLPLRP